MSLAFSLQTHGENTFKRPRTGNASLWQFCELGVPHEETSRGFPVTQVGPFLCRDCGVNRLNAMIGRAS